MHGHSARASRYWEKYDKRNTDCECERWEEVLPGPTWRSSCGRYDPSRQVCGQWTPKIKLESHEVPYDESTWEKKSGKKDEPPLFKHKTIGNAWTYEVPRPWVEWVLLAEIDQGADLMSPRTTLLKCCAALRRVLAGPFSAEIVFWSPPRFSAALHEMFLQRSYENINSKLMFCGFLAKSQNLSAMLIRSIQ